MNLGYGEDRNGKFKSPGYVSSSAFDPSVKLVGLGDYKHRGFHSKNYMVSMVVPFKTGKLNLSWTHSSSNLSNVYPQQNPGKSMASGDQDIVAASYVYPLSKRTSLYAYGS
ncbi:hypothetical protein [Orrella sp. 11846]|uniref:hypothetical protein n=1 Tax=Orrella sp. 11846 TaxID=3409913 RepID=UPI003B59AEF8